MLPTDSQGRQSTCRASCTPINWRGSTGCSTPTAKASTSFSPMRWGWAKPSRPSLFKPPSCKFGLLYPSFACSEAYTSPGASCAKLCHKTSGRTLSCQMSQILGIRVVATLYDTGYNGQETKAPASPVPHASCKSPSAQQQIVLWFLLRVQSLLNSDTDSRTPLSNHYPHVALLNHIGRPLYATRSSHLQPQIQEESDSDTATRMPPVENAGPRERDGPTWWWYP